MLPYRHTKQTSKNVAGAAFKYYANCPERNTSGEPLDHLLKQDLHRKNKHWPFQTYLEFDCKSPRLQDFKVIGSNTKSNHYRRNIADDTLIKTVNRYSSNTHENSIATVTFLNLCY